MVYVMPEWATDLYINEKEIPLDWDVTKEYNEEIQAQLVGEYLEKLNQ